MEGVTIFKLLNLVISLNDDERAIIATNDMFNNVREVISKDASFINVEDVKACKQQLTSLILITADNALDYLNGLEHTNKGMSNYLRNIVETRKVIDPLKASATLCALGNADLTYTEREGLDCLKSVLAETKEMYCLFVSEDKDYPSLNEAADRLVFLTVLAQIVCTFMVSKYGSEVGVGEHFGCNVKQVATDLSDKDTDHSESFEEEAVDGLEQFSHLAVLLQGLEEFHAADGVATQQSYAQRYLVGVMISQGHLPADIGGNEGAVWDKVKAAMLKAFQVVKDGLVAIKENYFDKSLQEMADDIKEAADANKKALAAVEQKDAVLTDSAKAGIERLAAATGNDGVKSAVGNLSNVSSAPGVIDKLMSEFTTVFNEGQALEKTFNEVDSDIKALESSISSDTPADGDKEAISVKKAAINEKSKEARAKFDDLKKQLAAQRKTAGAIAKAIKGITPSIFYAEKKEGGNDE